VSGFGRFAFDHEHLARSRISRSAACALVLPQVLNPRFVDEAFEGEPWIGRLVKSSQKYAPLRRRITTALIAVTNSARLFG
jgi:hypothetical protein